MGPGLSAIITSLIFKEKIKKTISFFGSSILKSFLFWSLPMSLFKVNDKLAFYLQDYYAKEWINNSMLFLEVDDLDRCRETLLKKNLPAKFHSVRFSEIRNEVWGRELFMHDPSGVLWHFGEFKEAPNS